MCSEHQHYLGRSPEYYLRWAGRQGPALVALFEKIFAQDRYPEQLYRSCDGLLALSRKTDLLILDDFGLTPLGQQNCLDFMELTEDRHARRATIIASQLPVASWYDLFAEETIADYPHFFIMRSNICKPTIYK